MIETKPFEVDHATEILSDPDDIRWARINFAAGPGFTLLQDGKVMGCGGVRTCGCGEAWATFSPEAKRSVRKSMFEQTKAGLLQIMDSEKLWHVVAGSAGLTDEQANFLEHLGFVRSECYVYIRKET